MNEAITRCSALVSVRGEIFGRRAIVRMVRGARRRSCLPCLPQYFTK
jgi:hypothetical protein